MDETSIVAALAAGGGVLAGAVLQGTLWLWDKTDHRFRTAVSHTLLVIAVVLMAEQLAVAPLRSLRAPLSETLSQATLMYNQGLEMAAHLLLLVPFAKWLYEWLSKYVEGLRKASKSNMPLPKGARSLLALEGAIPVLVLLSFGALWYISTKMG